MLASTSDTILTPGGDGYMNRAWCHPWTGLLHRAIILKQHFQIHLWSFLWQEHRTGGINRFIKNSCHLAWINVLNFHLYLPLRQLLFFLLLNSLKPVYAATNLVTSGKQNPKFSEKVQPFVNQVDIESVLCTLNLVLPGGFYKTLLKTTNVLYCVNMN